MYKPFTPPWPHTLLNAFAESNQNVTRLSLASTLHQNVEKIWSKNCFGMGMMHTMITSAKASYLRPAIHALNGGCQLGNAAGLEAFYRALVGVVDSTSCIR